jgi:hypothetical protein
MASGPGMHTAAAPPPAVSGGGSLHTDVYLSKYAQVDYAPQGFIWTQISPIIKVNKESDKYLIRQADRRHYSVLRAPGTPAHVVNVSYSEGDYSVDEYAAANFLDRRTRENTDDIYQLEETLIEQTKDVVWLDFEIRTRDLAQACSNATAISTAWDSTTATPTPQADVDAAKLAIMGRIGKAPNRIKMSTKALWALDRYLKAASYISEMSTLVQTAQALSELWGLKVVSVFNQYDTSDPSDTASLSQIWTETEAIVYYAEESPNLMAQGFMQTFLKRRGGDADLSERVRRWFDDPTECDWFEFSMLAEPQVTNEDAAQRLTGVVS